MSIAWERGLVSRVCLMGSDFQKFSMFEALPHSLLHVLSMYFVHQPCSCSALKIPHMGFIISLEGKREDDHIHPSFSSIGCNVCLGQ